MNAKLHNFVYTAKLNVPFVRYKTYDNVMRKSGKSHRSPYAVRSDSVRNPIGRRTQSDRAAYGIRSDGVRVTVTKRE